MFGLPLWILVFLGYSASFFSGLFGIGGGWIVTPILFMLGISAISAVGTGFGFVLFSSVISFLFHKKSKNVDMKKAVILSIGSITGVFLSSKIVKYLEFINLFEKVFKILYIGLLFIIGLLCFCSFKIKKIKSKNLFLVILAGLFTGILSGILGIGGGLILFPFLIYIFGLPPPLAAGTSLLPVIFSSIIGILSYLPHYISFPAILWLVVGGILGSFLGVKSLNLLPKKFLTGLFGLIVAISLISIAFKTDNSKIFSFILFGFVTLISLIISLVTIFNIKNKKN